MGMVADLARMAKYGGLPSAAKQFAEKLDPSTSGAKALVESKGFIAALKALRHPKASFSANCKAASRVARDGTAKAVPFPKPIVPLPASAAKSWVSAKRRLARCDGGRRA